MKLPDKGIFKLFFFTPICSSAKSTSTQYKKLIQSFIASPAQPHQGCVGPRPRQHTTVCNIQVSAEESDQCLSTGLKLGSTPHWGKGRTENFSEVFPFQEFNLNIDQIEFTYIDMCISLFLFIYKIYIYVGWCFIFNLLFTTLFNKPFAESQA